MTSLAPGASSSLASPALVAFTGAVVATGIFLADPFALSFAIDDLHDPTIPAAQIYPAPSGAVAASVESTAGPFVLADSMTLIVRFEDGVTQTLGLTTAAFAAIGGDISNAPAWQVATVVNELLAPGKSFPSSAASKVTIASDVPGAGGSVEILGGTANVVLGFPTAKVIGSGGTAAQQPVDLVNDRLSTGRFVATWTVPSQAPTGRYRVRWYLTQASRDLVRSWSEDFEVLAQPSSGTSYALVADVRAEGVTVAQASDRRISDALANASRLIELWTGRSFTARYKSIRVDAPSTDYLLLDEPICAIEGVRYRSDVAGTFADPSGFEVYGRHLSQGLLSPDDRESPKVVFKGRGWGLGCGDGEGVGYSGGYGYGLGYESLGRGYRSGAQQIEIVGVFGYTDPDPSGGAPCGVTPRNIARACVLLALRELPKAAGPDPTAAFDATHAHAVVNQRTREQSIQWSDNPSTRGPTLWTGDPAIDSILLSYRKALSVSGV